jgi:glucosyl-dolichyl phosphate glucuronosyltransferase
MASSKTFTVAICTRNRAGFLRRCLEALVQTLNEEDAPVFVIDNGSTDATAEVISEFSPRISGLFEAAIGLSNARNLAVSACETEYLVFLDDDGIPDLSWGPSVSEIAKRNEADLFGGPYEPFYTVTKPAWFDNAFGSAHLDLDDGEQPPNVCFSGGNMGWRVRLLREAGGFDPALGIVGNKLRLGEETALQISLRRANPKLHVIFASGMSMKHYVSPEKMTLGYIHKRNYTYGWQLPEIDPTNPINSISLLDFAKLTKLGSPLLVRRFWRDRAIDPDWRSYAARYLSLNSILMGAQARRLFGKSGN